VNIATPYDAIVIGAGVIGASIAFHLARLGLTSTLVLERNSVCSGNTRKSGALVRMHYTNQPEARLALASLRYFQHWSELVGGSAGFQKVGFILLVGPENADRLERNVAMQQALGINTRVVDVDELREIQPALQVTDGSVAAFEPDSGYADPVEATYSFVRTAHMLGVTVLEEVAVTSIRQRGGKVQGVSTTQGNYEAPIVICAANIWSPALLGTAGVKLELKPRRAQIGYVARPEALRERAPAVLDLAQLNWSRPQDQALYLVGTPILEREDVDPDNYDEANDPVYADVVRRQIADRFPVLAKATYLRGHAGLYDMSQDTRAILDRAPGVEGLFIAAGFSGSGFKISPIVGACLAELAVEGQSRSADIRPFRLSRFAEGDPIQGAHEYTLPGSWGMRW
jgi:sarcosine oxidase subunit beta